MKKLKGSPRLQAFKDIAEWIRNENMTVMDGNMDVWTVTGHRMDTPEQRKLNRKLGLHRVNMKSKYE